MRPLLDEATPPTKSVALVTKLVCRLNMTGCSGRTLVPMNVPASASGSASSSASSFASAASFALPSPRPASMPSPGRSGRRLGAPGLARSLTGPSKGGCGDKEAAASGCGEDLYVAGRWLRREAGFGAKKAEVAAVD